jgi:hypothetical protein
MTLPGGQSAPLKAYVRDIGRQERVLTLTYILAYVIYCVPSALIYLDKGNAIESNVLSSFSADDWIIIIIQVGVFLKVTMTFAGVHMIYQIWISQMVWGRTTPPNAWKRAILMILTYIVVLVMANFLTDLLPVLGIGGAMGLLGMYVMAPLAELKENGWNWKAKQGIIDIVLITIGMFTLVVSSIYSIKSAVDFFANPVNYDCHPTPKPAPLPIVPGGNRTRSVTFAPGPSVTPTQVPAVSAIASAIASAVPAATPIPAQTASIFVSVTPAPLPSPPPA